MTQKIKLFIQQNQLLEDDKVILVALSGGADSVALLRLLIDLKYKVIALHCNFHLRGEESDRDEAFVTQLCKKHNITLFVHHFDTLKFAKEQHMSIEMAARHLRYEWFNQKQAELHAQCVAVAHHKNDQTETLLLNLLRGSGLRGLAGIMPKRDNIVRPLLNVTRDEIMSYLKEINQEYVTDSTNLEKDALRNIIRLDIIPQLKEINPQIIKTVSDTCSIIQDTISFYDLGIRHAFEKYNITEKEFPIYILKEKPSNRVLLYEWLKDKGFNKTQVKEIENSTRGNCGKTWVSKSCKVLRDRDNLYIRPLNDTTHNLQLEQKYVDKITDKGPDIAYFDADKLEMPIEVRPIKTGDWFIPFGMKGKKLISKYLTDIKANLFEKEEQKVATCGDNIIWLIGKRSDNRFRVDNETKRIIRLRVINYNEEKQ